MSKNMHFALIVGAILLILSACSPAAEETVSPEPVAASLPSIVSATGEVIPEVEALLSVSAGGVVEGVLVAKGDPVSTGQVLVKLEGSDLHLKVGRPPLVRVKGELKPLSRPPIDAEDHHLVY